MRYFSYHEPVESDEIFDGSTAGVVMTVSEDWIRENYYPWWYEQMCRKFGKETVDTVYSFNECIEDWCVIHWAWEVIE